MTRAVTYVELDIDFCQLTHGTSPCTATGEPCYNSLSTCQDRQNFCGLAFETVETDYSGGVVPIFESYYSGETPSDLTYWYNEQTAWEVGTDSSPSDLILTHDPASDGNNISLATWNGYNANNCTVKALLWSEISGNDRGKAGVAIHVSGVTLFSGYVAILENNGGTMQVSLYRAYLHNPATAIRYGNIGATLTRLGFVVVTGNESTWRHIKIQFLDGALKVRHWLYGDTEPTTWDIETSDSSPLNPGATGVINAHCRTDNSIRCADFYASSPAERTTLRWVTETGYNPTSIEAIPSLKQVSYTPTTISLGADLGERASITATFNDHPWSDTLHGYDPYFASRSYNPYNQGTYWGKFRARQLYIQGRPFRLIRGTDDQSYADMTTYHFLADGFSGPDPQTGAFSIVAKDVLKFVDSDRTKAPVLSDGYLLVPMTASAAMPVTVTLPTGTGKHYPNSGHVAIGGTEIFSYQNNGNNTLTLTARAQLNTAASAHEAEERIQWILSYSGEDAADIIYDLLVTYGEIDSDYIDLTAWQTETTSHLGNVYSAYIAEPTSVKDLIAGLVEEAALALWWNPVSQKIELRVLRGIDTESRAFTNENILKGTTKIEEQPSSRLTEVWVYYGRRNPLKSLDDTDNYQSAYAEVDLQVESDHGVSSIKVIMSRWIAIAGRSAAERIAQIFISRFKVPPRKVSFEVFYNNEVVLGEGYNLTSWSSQDASGAAETIPIQVTRVTPLGDKYQIEAQEQLFDYEVVGAGTDRTITFNSSTANVNLRSIHDNIYPEILDESPMGSPSYTITCIIEQGVYIYSMNTANPAFDVGDWPNDVVITLVLRGTIVGAGGKGGSSPSPREGGDGGTALYVRRPIRLELDVGAGAVWGGGGGGVGGEIRISGKLGGGAGGGAGMIAGDGGTGGAGDGSPGALELGGAGETNHTSDACPGSDGGDLGQPGDSASCAWNYAAPGSAGLAIDGISYVDKIGTGDIRGDEVN